MFLSTRFDYRTLENRFRELSALNTNIRVLLTDNRRLSDAFHCENGTADLLCYLNDLSGGDRTFGNPITVEYDPPSMTSRTLDMAAGILACGVDPERAVLFVQSRVSEHTELACTEPGTEVDVQPFFGLV